MDNLLPALFLIGVFGGAYSTSFLAERLLHCKLPNFARGVYTLIVGSLLYCAIAYALLAIWAHSGPTRE
jgi:hypothetical protein